MEPQRGVAVGEVSDGTPVGNRCANVLERLEMISIISSVSPTPDTTLCWTLSYGWNLSYFALSSRIAYINRTTAPVGTEQS